MSTDLPGQTPDLPPAPPAAPAQPAPYGQPAQHGQPPAYGQPPYGQPPQYGQPQHPQTPPYAQTPHYAQPQYGQAPYGQTPYGAYAAPKKTNVLAVISMIASIVGFVWILPFVGSLAGVIMGHISLRQISQTAEGGRGMALAGLIVGYVGLAFFVIGAIIFFSFVAYGVSQGTRYA